MSTLTKKLLKVFLLAVAIACGYFVFKALTPKHQKIIAITQIAPHPSLDKIYQGIEDELKSWEGIGKYKIVRENAQGNMALASQIAQKFLSLKPTAAVAISTPSAQSLCTKLKTSKTPFVFAAVSDPEASKLTPEDYGNISGISDPIPVDKHVAMIKKFVPHVKSIGTLFNPSEASSVSTIRRLTVVCEELGIKLITVPVNRSVDIPVAAKGLVGKIDALFMGTDNTFVLALDNLVQLTIHNKIPFFVSDPESVQRGALAGIVYDEYQIGKDVGKIVRRVLKGEPVRSIPISAPSTSKTMVNEETASKIGIVVPTDIKQQTSAE